MTNEQLLAAPGRILHFPDRAGRRRAGLQRSRRDAAEVHRTAAGRHLPREDHEVERCRRSPRRTRASTCRPTDITVVHRSDGSGTTYIWVDYLAKVSPEWKQKVGVNTSVNWPVGVGGKGQRRRRRPREADARLHRLRRAHLCAQNKISYGPVQNMAGDFVNADVNSVTAAAAARLPTCRKTSACRSRTPRARALSDFVVHVDPPLRKPEGQEPGEDLGRLHEMGAGRRPEIRGRISAMRRCRPALVQQEMDQLARIKLQ